MTNITDGNLFRLLSSLLASLIQFESTYVNWDMLIGIAEDETFSIGTAWQAMRNRKKERYFIISIRVTV